MFLLFFFFCFISQRFVYRSSNVCMVELTVDALCSWREQCVTRGVRADVLEEKCVQ